MTEHLFGMCAHIQVLMEKHWEKERKVTVCANFGATATSYSTLLEYSM